MRKIAQPFGRMANARAFKTIQDLAPRRLFTHSPVQRQDFVQLFFQSMQRIKGHHRLLKDHGNLIPANAAQRVFVGM
jgi:hypothetical protein